MLSIISGATVTYLNIKDRIFAFNLVIKSDKTNNT